MYVKEIATIKKASPHKVKFALRVKLSSIVKFALQVKLPFGSGGCVFSTCYNKIVLH